MALFASTAWTQEIRPPEKCLCSPPQTALAQATKKDDALEIKLKLVNIQQTTVQKQVAVEKVKEVEGKQVKYTETVLVSVCVPKPHGWNEITLNTKNKPVIVYDVRGKSVAWKEVAKALTKEKPVLVSVEPVDPFYLQTMKPETLVIVAPVETIYGPQKSLIAPSGSPQPVPVVPVIQPRPKQSKPSQ